MTPKPVSPRARALLDVEEALDFHLAQQAEGAALKLITDLEDAFRHVSTHPRSGSPRLGQETGIGGLRTWPLRRMPFLVCYVDQPDHVDVLRVLHTHRDIPAWLLGDDDRPTPR